MEPTTETSVLSRKSLFGLLFSSYKLPLLSLVILGSIGMRALHPEAFHFGQKRQKTYRFKSSGSGFLMGDMNFFMNTPDDEAEEQIVKLFPDKMQKKVKKVVRPVLILAEKHQLDPFWVLSVMWTESHFKHESKSHKGARGLMQLMPPTYMETIAAMKKAGIFLESDRGEEYLRYQYGQVYYDMGYSKLVSKLRNLEVGIYYLKGLLEKFNYNYYYATVSYNMGPNWTREQLREGKPIRSSHQYLSRVMKNYFYITKSLGPSNNVSYIPRI